MGLTVSNLVNVVIGNIDTVNIDIGNIDIVNIDIGNIVKTKTIEATT